MNLSATISSTEPAVAAGELAFAPIDGPAGPLRIAWARPAAAARATLLVLQGRGEFNEKYAPFAREVTGWGLAFVTLEWRGQGGSVRLLPDPRRGHIDDFSDYLDDLDALQTVLPGLGLAAPRYLLGHSMGGQIAIRALGDRRIAVERAVLVAPMLGIELGWMPFPLAMLIGQAAMRLGMAGAYGPGQRHNDARELVFAGNGLTTDAGRFAWWKGLVDAHQALVIGGATYGWIAASLRSIARASAPAYLAAITTPTLLILAGRERIVDNRAIRQAAQHLADARLVELPAAMHDVFLASDAERDVMLRAIAEFLEPSDA